jgi:hypothetical protein
MCDLNFLLASGASRHVHGRLTPSGFRYLADQGLIPIVRTQDGVRLFRIADVDAIREKLDAEDRDRRPAAEVRSGCR